MITIAVGRCAVGSIPVPVMAELAFSFQIFDSQMNLLTIYDPPNGSQVSGVPEPATWVSVLIGLAGICGRLRRQEKS